jgi:carbon storage regulator
MLGDLPMLIFRLGKGEQIAIDEDVEVTVLEIKGDVVRLRFRAPDETMILESELYDDGTQLDSYGDQSYHVLKLQQIELPFNHGRVVEPGLLRSGNGYPPRR